MLAPAAQALKTRCRQIAESDLDRLADVLARGFTRSSPGYWLRGFARFAAMPVIEGVPRFGYVLESGQDIVGVILLISSQRGDRIISNLSSWYVEPAWRTHSTLLISMATKLKHVTYLNASPAPHTWRTLQAQGFRPFNFGRSAVFPVLGFGGGTVRTEIPHDLPERALLEAHANMGCISLICEKDGVAHPFVFRAKRLDKPPLTMMELIYCRGTEDFRRCGAALGRWFLRRGAPGFIIDGKIAGMVAHYAAGKEPRYFKGPQPPTLNDLAFTEKVIFG